MTVKYIQYLYFNYAAKVMFPKGNTVLMKINKTSVFTAQSWRRKLYYYC